MIRLSCKCGETMWNSQIPNDIQIWAFTDRQIDKILEKDRRETPEFCEMYDYEVWLCPNCKRLHILEGKSNTTRYIYHLEETFDAADVMSQYDFKGNSSNEAG